MFPQLNLLQFEQIDVFRLNFDVDCITFERIALEVGELKSDLFVVGLVDAVLVENGHSPLVKVAVNPDIDVLPLIGSLLFIEFGVQYHLNQILVREFELVLEAYLIAVVVEYVILVDAKKEVLFFSGFHINGELFRCIAERENHLHHSLVCDLHVFDEVDIPGLVVIGVNKVPAEPEAILGDVFVFFIDMHGILFRREAPHQAGDKVGLGTGKANGFLQHFDFFSRLDEQNELVAAVAVRNGKI